jgi:hypothetical protein
MVSALMLVLTLSATAQRGSIRHEGIHWVEETYGTVPAATEVVVILPEGSIVVNGNDPHQISWLIRKRVRAANESDARHLFPSARLTTRRQGNRLWLETQFTPAESNIHVEMTVSVPRSTHLVKLYSRSGSMHITGLDGATVLKLGAGSVRVDRISGPVFTTIGMGTVDIGKVGGDLAVHATGARVRIGSVQGHIVTQSGGGSISIGSARQGINAQTSSGDISVGHGGAEVVLTSGGGSLDLGSVAGKATLQTTVGNIKVGHADGPVTATSGGGKINLWGLTHGADARVNGSGPITAEFLQGYSSNSSLQTPSGDVVIYMNPTVRATVQATIEMGNSHRMTSSFPELRVNSDNNQYGPLKVLCAEGRLNGGGPVLRVRTTNGNISFRRANR